VYWIIGSFFVLAVVLFHVTTNFKTLPENWLDESKDIYIQRPGFTAIVLLFIVASWIALWPIFAGCVMFDGVKRLVRRSS
jgi:hypothetical protein